MPTLSKIAPSFWFVKEAEEAASLYVSAFPDSRIDRVWTLEVETPSGPPGSVKVVEFTLAGQSFTAMDAGKLDDFNHAISFTVNCEDQAEIDHYWDALQAGGGSPDAVQLSVLPMFHVTGMQGGMNAPIFSGATIVLMTRWDRDCAALLIQRRRVTSWTNITAMLIDFLANPKRIPARAWQ